MLHALFARLKTMILGEVSVASLTSGVSSLVAQLRALADAHEDMAVVHDDTIKVATAAKDASIAEADKARRVAGNLAALVEGAKA